jgi:hypothetical protein
VVVFVLVFKHGEVLLVKVQASLLKPRDLTLEGGVADRSHSPGLLKVSLLVDELDPLSSIAHLCFYPSLVEHSLVL